MEPFHSIENLYRDEEALNGLHVVATEKLHGTNCGICLHPDGSVEFHGRNHSFGSIAPDEPWVESPRHEFDAYGFRNWCVNNIERPAGVVAALYGEFVGPGIQKGINYGPEKRFVVFAGKQNSEWMPFYEAQRLAHTLGLKTAPVLFDGIFDVDRLKAIYDGDSVLAKCLGVEQSPNVMEGVVITPMDPSLKDKYGHSLVFKLKNEKWTEVARAPKPRPIVDSAAEGAILDYLATYLTPIRLEHVLQHIHEDTGQPVTNMERTREVMAAMAADLAKETDQSGLDSKLLGKHLPKMTAQLLKEHLLV